MSKNLSLREAIEAVALDSGTPIDALIAGSKEFDDFLMGAELQSGLASAMPTLESAELDAMTRVLSAAFDCAALDISELGYSPCPRPTSGPSR